MTSFTERRNIFLGLISFLILVSLACNFTQRDPAVLVVTATGEPATAQTGTAVPPTTVDTPVIQTVIVTQPPVDPATPVVQTVVVTEPTATQAPSPTPLVLRTVPIEGDEDLIQGRIIFPDYQPAATTDLVFLAEARNPSLGDEDGAGISTVDFAIFDSNGTEVYRRTEERSRYCAFSGGEPDCVIFRFADTNFTWPGTGLPIQNGLHTLVVTVNAADGNSWSGQAEFNIQLP